MKLLEKMLQNLNNRNDQCKIILDIVKLKNQQLNADFNIFKEASSQESSEVPEAIETQCKIKKSSSNFSRESNKGSNVIIQNVNNDLNCYLKIQKMCLKNVLDSSDYQFIDTSKGVESSFSTRTNKIISIIELDDMSMNSEAERKQR